MDMEYWQRLNNGGAHCPCCDRWGKVNTRPINITMVRCLAWLRDAPADEQGWTHVPRVAPRWLLQSKQLSSLRWWGFVERPNKEEYDQPHSGKWRITAEGQEYLYGQPAPKTVDVYDGEVVDVSDEMHVVSDVKGYFEYAEIFS